MTGLWLASYVALWILWLAVVVVLVSLLRNVGAVYSTINSLAFATSGRVSNNGTVRSALREGEKLPEVSWRTASGESKSVSQFLGSKIAFVLVSASCGACTHALAVAQASGPDPDDPHLRHMVIVSLSDAQETAKLLDGAGIAAEAVVLFDREATIRQKWGVEITPVIVIVDEELRVVRQVLGTNPRPEKEQFDAVAKIATLSSVG
jgi:hypothetical protein